jgi:tripartite-type tricarboxylate transporter receptor subunit TctC
MTSRPASARAQAPGPPSQRRLAGDTNPCGPLAQSLQAPARTPPDIINRLNTDINKILQQPDMLRLMADNGAEAGGGPPERLGNFVKSEIAKWGAVVKAANIKIE